MTATEQIEMPTDPVERDRAIEALKERYAREAEIDRLALEQTMAKARLFLDQQDEEARRQQRAERERTEATFAAKRAAEAAVAEATKTIALADAAIRADERRRESAVNKKLIAFYTEVKANPEQWSKWGGGLDHEAIARQEAKIRRGVEDQIEYAFPSAPLFIGSQRI